MYRLGNKAPAGSQQCQKCLKTGHWSYECTNKRTYLYRPSRTTIEKNPHLKQKQTFERGPKGPAVHDGDRKRSTLAKEEDSSSSGSDSDADGSEGEKLQKELTKLIEEHKSMQDAKKKSALVPDSSDSESSSSSEKSRSTKR